MNNYYFGGTESFRIVDIKNDFCERTLQAGVLLVLCRQSNATLTDAAGALRVRPPTLQEVVKDLVRKRWVAKHRSVTDRRAVHVRLSRRGQALAQRIEEQVRAVSTQINYKIVAKQK